MRLKSIDIKGFKSFGDKTTIHFNENVTGIVGPNGSGKSNIVDAIRWVLGEQKSRELRLEAMSDVLFNGTKKRRAANSAEVTLTFENTKNILATSYSAVAISRVLFRNGDSEYRINDVKCRLKDIRNLFLDSGIGSNSYSIIALGMVEDILSDRDKARRTMFEQAAGITKFKVQKAETLSKLKQADQDLLRLEDLIFEIEDNLKSLEKQARRAKKYLKIKDEYKALSLDYASRSFAAHLTSFEELKKKIQQERQAEAELNRGLHGKEAELQELKARNIHLEKDLSHAQKAMNEVVERIRSTEEEMRKLNDRKDYLGQSVHRDHKTREQNQQKLEEKEKEIIQLKGQVETLTPQINEADKQHQSVKIKLKEAEESSKSQRSELKAFQSKLSTLSTKKTELEKKSALDEARLKSLRHDHLRAQEEVTIQDKEITSLLEEQNKANEKLKDARAALSDLEEKITNREEKIDHLQVLRENQKDELVKLEKHLHALQKEYNILKNLADQLEGFPESLKFLNKESKKWSINSKLLADLIDVEPSYRIAIESFLEPYLNCFIVENKSQASQGISLLVKHQKGKAGFLVLDEITKTENGAISALPYTSAIDVIDTDEEYRGLFAHLLRGTYIVDSLDDIQEGELDEGYNFLSRDGHVLRRKGWITGGSVGLFEGKKVGRNRQLDKLLEKIKSHQASLTKTQKDFDKIIKELNDLKNNTELSKKHKNQINELGAIERESIKLETQLKGKRERQESLKQRLSLTEKDILNIEEQSPKTQNELAELQGEIGKLESSLKDLDMSYQSGAQAFARLNQEYNEKQINIVKLQNSLDQSEAGIKRVQRDKNELIQTNREIDRRLQKFKEEVDEISSKQETNTQYLKGSNDKKVKLSQRLSETEKEFFSAKGKENEIEDAIRQVNKNLRQQNDIINQLREKFGEVQIQMGKITERAEVEFGLSIEDLKNHHPNLDIDDNTLSNKLEKLKQSIRSFGEVNPMSLEAYEATKERYEEIIEQRTDVLESKASLIETIKEIEVSVNERFMDTFEKVKINFKNVFRTLFTAEDDCDLILVNPEEMVGSGIEIIAKPKGKRPKSISQLSGGEKTLTAVALLFALYLHKPAPFCVFDEVDAPLDDTNITKFNNIIREFSQESQFIVITHNKLTMSEVDVIYGVFMQEVGISKVGAVDFRSFEHELEYEAVV